MMRLWLLLFTLATAFAASPPQKVFPFPYTQQDLPNGLRLVTIPTGFPNLVSLYIVVQTGSRNEIEPGKSGFAHLFEHMMFRGTERYPAPKYTSEVKRIGAAQNAYTDDDLTVYHTTFSKEDLDLMLMLEADRFQHLKYSPELFKTETLAVLGEYNKSSADPSEKLFEVLRDTAYSRHTYKHTTIGFLKDIQDMPNQFEYSLQFFNRYYRPEYTTVIVAGDVTSDKVRPMVDRYWAQWKRGNYRAEIPPEPAQEEAKTAKVEWPTPTLAWWTVGFHMPAYSDSQPDWAALKLLSYLGFSENSDLYQKLVIKEQKVDVLDGGIGPHVDPYLFSVAARIKNDKDVPYVRQQVLGTIESFVNTEVDKDRLEAVKRHLKYSFALGLDNTEAVAGAAARYVALRRTPETINRLYDLYDSITPADIKRVAQTYFRPKNGTEVTLTGKGGNAQ
jgi:zinc protease